MTVQSKIIVVKIGGATLGSHDTTIDDLVSLQKDSRQVVVVHGGGKTITEWLAKQGVATKFVRGERVTDKATLEVVVSVLAGLVNKQIVAEINGRGGRAVGISGVDGSLIQAKVANPELGYVGVVKQVDLSPVKALLQAGYIPVIAPVGFAIDKVEDSPQILNINADLVAGEIAAALGAERLIFLTDVEGIRDQAGKLIPRLSVASAESLIASGVASGGMIPKIRACLKALGGSSSTCIIDGRSPHALLSEVEKGGTGTTIESSS
ncbi:MAG: acetylglutamate kinase [Chloroflexi bacterium]|nr:acetylglutamate kinase [Chloroflexota bacterium]